MLSRKRDGWKGCVVESDWKANEREEKKPDVQCAGMLLCSGNIWFWWSSLQDGLSCNEFSIAQARWGRCGLSIWDEEPQLNFWGPSECWDVPLTLPVPWWCATVPFAPAGAGGTRRDGWPGPTHRQLSSSPPATSQSLPSLGLEQWCKI